MAGPPQQGCAVLSRLLAEPMPATAPPGGGSWLAVEHPGPWPPRWADTLPPALRAVLARATTLGIRPQLIRRPGRRPTPTRHRTVLICSHRGPRPWLEQAVVDDLERLAGLDLAAVAAGHRPGFGVLTDTRMLLVCAHGRRDVCCARHGRPVAAALAARWPDQVWETTHLSGDRFAANVACLPDGTYHGRVTADTALDVGAACLAGRVHLAHYRGRAGLPGPAQAAEHAVRLLTGDTRLDTVTVEHVDTDHGDASEPVRVVLTLGRQRFAVPVRQTPSGPPRPTTCTACQPEAPVSYQAGTPRPLTDTPPVPTPQPGITGTPARP